MFPPPGKKQKVTPKEIGEQLYVMLRRKRSIRGTDLQYAMLRNTRLPETDLSYGQLRYANLFQSVFQGASFRFADLRDGQLQRCQLMQSDFHHANLLRAKLESVNLIRSSLQFTNARQAKFNQARMIECDLRFAIFDIADLRGCDLRFSDLRGASLRQCQYQNTSRMGCRIDQHTVERSGWNSRDLQVWLAAGARYEESHLEPESLADGLWVAPQQGDARWEAWLTALLQLLQLEAQVVHMTEKQWCLQSRAPLFSVAELLVGLAHGTASDVELTMQAPSKEAWVAWKESLRQGLRLALTVEGKIEQRWVVDGTNSEE